MGRKTALTNIKSRLEYLKQDAEVSRYHDEYERGYYNAIHQALEIIRQEEEENS